MGKATETGDDIPMRHRIAGEIIHSRGARFRRQGGKQLDTLVLDRRVLAVLQGKVEENPVNRGHLAVSTGGDCPASQCQCPAVTGEGAGGTAVDVAGELVQQKHQCDQPGVAPGPAVQLAGEPPAYQVAKTRGDGGVGLRVGTEPEAVFFRRGKAGLIQGTKPELPDGGDILLLVPLSGHYTPPNPIPYVKVRVLRKQHTGKDLWHYSPRSN